MTGPLIALAKVDRLALLESLFGRVVIPAVRPTLEEIRQRGYWLSDKIMNVAAKLADELD